MPDFDEFGIPIKKSPQSQTDEFGIPIRKQSVALPSLSQQAPDIGIQPVGTFNQPKQKKNFNFKEYLQGVPQDAPQKQAVNHAGTPIGARVGRTYKPDVKEAIDKAVIERNKQFGADVPDMNFGRDEITKKVKEGELVPDLNPNGESVLKQKTGFFESFLNAVNKASVENADAKNIASLSDDDKIKYLEAKKVIDAQNDNTKAGGALGNLGEFVGENADVLAKGAVGAMTGGTLAPGLVGAGHFGAFLTMVDDFAKGGYSNTLQKTYGELRQQGVPEKEAMAQAHKAGLVGEATGIAAGAVLSGLPSLKPNAEIAESFLNHLAKSSAKMGGVSGAQAGVNDLGEMAVGVHKDAKEIINDVGESTAHGIAVGAAFEALLNVHKVPAKLYEQATKVVASIPEAVREDFINKAVEAGTLPPEKAEEIRSAISVLRPEEINRPEAVTISPKENVAEDKRSPSIILSENNKEPNIVELKNSNNEEAKNAVKTQEVNDTGTTKTASEPVPTNEALPEEQASKGELSPSTDGIGQRNAEITTPLLDEAPAENNSKNKPIEQPTETEGNTIGEPNTEGQAAKEGGGEPPKAAEATTTEPIDFNPKSILNRLHKSKNINPSAKAKLEAEGLQYKPQSHAEARSLAKDVIKEYGHQDAVALAEANKFDGGVNSMVFAEALDQLYELDRTASAADKNKYAEQWADVAIRYDKAARGSGRFGSAIDDFYKRSPVGVQIAEKSKRDEAFKEWFKNKEKNYKSVFEELTKTDEFKAVVKEKVDEQLKQERAANRLTRRKKIESVFDSAKITKGKAMVTVIPPPIWNAAVEVMKQATLAGESLVSVIEKGVAHIRDNHSEKFDEDAFRKEWEAKLKGVDGETKPTELTTEKKEKFLERFSKKLTGLDGSQKEAVIRKSFKKLIENGALEYEDFKKIIAETLGYGELSEAEAKKLTELVKDINVVDEIANTARESRDEADLKKYQEARKKAEKSATELGALVYNKPKIIDRVLGIMQLNTLGIPSLINNPIFNIWNQATVRFPIGLQLTAIDQLLYGASKVSNKLWGTEVLLPENNIFKSQKEFFGKVAEGGKQSTEQLFTGLTNRDYFQKEVHTAQIHPLTSIKDLWAYSKGEKNLTKGQLADKALQGTIGVPAEIVARMLNIGDKPQRYAAEGAQAAVFAKNLGLKGIDYKLFMEFPKEEAYRKFKAEGMDEAKAMAKAEEVKNRIIKQGEESVFQQDNLLNDVINNAFKPLGTFGEIIKRFNMPFVKIPLNAYWSVFNLINPEVALLQSAVYGYRAFKNKSALDLQQSKKWFAHATTGIAMMAVAGAITRKGAVNPDNEDKTTKKERTGEKTYEQQNAVNVSKLNSILHGRNPDDVKNGVMVDLKWFGNVGNILEHQAARMEEMTPEQRKNGSNMMSDMMANLDQSALNFMDKGVFSNSSSLFLAMNKGGEFANSYFLNLINMGMNTIQPAMFAQVERASLPYFSKVKADSFAEELKNNLLTRSVLARKITGEYPPSQINVWGDVMERKDGLGMKLFGMSSTKKDNFAQPIYEDYKRTGNTKFLPPAVMPLLNQVKLNAAEAKKLETLVGQARKSVAAPYMNDMATLEGFDGRYSDLKDEDKIRALSILYQEGFNQGKEQFITIYPKFAKAEVSEDKQEENDAAKTLRSSVKNR